MQYKFKNINFKRSFIQKLQANKIYSWLKSLSYNYKYFSQKFLYPQLDVEMMCIKAGFYAIL